MRNWTIVWSMNQTKGKGLEKNYWNVEKGKNLTFSVFLKSINLALDKGYIINLLISNAIHKTLFFYNKNFWIKWPNDIIFMNKKIGGILTENSIYHRKIHRTIIGIGLNVNQMKFDENFQATSMKIIFNKNFKLEKLFYKLILSIQKEYLFFTSYGEVFVRNYYMNHLYRKNQISYFYNNKINKYIQGTIRNITKEGYLVIEENHNKKLYCFSTKEIKLIY
ncbi:biotin-(acetyl-CoA carboxylase) ligase [Blattabacterium sp. (Mastotermes darwiniensis) str. MADAR]|nr:biotin-(acetyl-CoA carboxylase) ligase [Blattabacterium sp. (Mastotermes darwiniensis) str. MADAR]